MVKVLVSSPTASVKNYCDKQWIDNCMNFKYLNYDVVLFDNTEDNSLYTNSTNEWFKENYGVSNTKFKMINSLEIHNRKNVPLKERMVISHNDVIDYALKNKYEYVLHLESDVFPSLDVIERLIQNRKKVCGALYYRDEGEYRRLMIQQHFYKAPNVIISDNFKRQDDLCFIDGETKKVSHVGLGCVLIHVSVFNKIRFRYDKNQDVFPDSLFSEDCFRNKIGIYADTSLICRHDNQAWDFINVK